MKIPIRINKKTAFIILAAVILVAIIILLIIFQAKRHSRITPAETTATFTPVFLSTEEKQDMKIPDDLKVQVLNRDSNGEVMTYKIIKTETDVVAPGTLKSFRPAK